MRRVRTAKNIQGTTTEIPKMKRRVTLLYIVREKWKADHHSWEDLWSVLPTIIVELGGSVRKSMDYFEDWINHQRQSIQHQETGHTKVSITRVENLWCDSR